MGGQTNDSEAVNIFFEVRVTYKDIMWFLIQNVIGLIYTSHYVRHFSFPLPANSETSQIRF